LLQFVRAHGEISWEKIMKKITCIKPLLLIALLSLTIACSKKSETAADGTGQSQGSEATSAQNGNTSAPDSSSAPAAAPVAAPAPEPPPPPPPPKPVVIPAGTVITVRLSSALGSKTSQTGDLFMATVAEPVTVENKTVVASGSSATGTVVEAKAKGKVKGEARLNLALNKLTIKGKTYDIQTTMAEQTEKGKGKRTAVATGGGAAGGALIGGIAGGGKGAGIGALVGAGAGFIGGTFTGNKQIELPAETVLPFKLTAPITLR
jgi:hypothetical protein